MTDMKDNPIAHSGRAQGVGKHAGKVGIYLALVARTKKSK